MTTDGMVTMLRVRGWERHYENSRTKEMKRMVWVPVTTRLDSEGYSTLMENRSGPSHFGCWIALLEVASQCSPRGSLRKSDRSPHDHQSLGRLTRIDPRTIKAAIEALTRIGWLEEVEVPAVPPPRHRREPAVQPAVKTPTLTDTQSKEGADAADAAGGTGQTPPAAGPERGPDRRLLRPREPLPPAAVETLARLREVVLSGASDPPRTASCSPPRFHGGARVAPGRRSLLREEES